MAVLGIDPGAKGALVLLGGGTPRSAPLPYAKGAGLLVAELVDLLAELRADRRVDLVVVERAQSFPGQGVASGFRYGRDYGAILGVLGALCLPHVTVPPATWHRAIVGGEATDRAGAKARALVLVQQRLPDLELPRAKDAREGVVDAACLALWGQTQVPR